MWKYDGLTYFIRYDKMEENYWKWSSIFLPSRPNKSATQGTSYTERERFISAFLSNNAKVRGLKFITINIIIIIFNKIINSQKWTLLKSCKTYTQKQKTAVW